MKRSALFAMPDQLTASAPPSAKGVDVPERITRAIIAAKERYAAENRDKPNGFTIRRAIEAARAQWRLERPGKVNGRDPIFDAIAEACGINLSELNKPAAQAIGGAKKDIMEASPEVTPDEVIRRAARYRVKYRDAACTPRALASHWAEFPLPARKTSLYDEPVGWHDTLRRLGETNRWDSCTVNQALTSKWLELSTTLREEIVKGMRP